MATYNPFRTVTDTLPDAINSGTCYATAFYTDEATAMAVGAFVRDRGDIANGGMLDGMALGQVERNTRPDGTILWSVTYA